MMSSLCIRIQRDAARVLHSLGRILVLMVGNLPLPFEREQEKGEAASRG